MLAVAIAALSIQSRTTISPTTTTVNPVARSTSSVLQSSPIGVAELIHANVMTKTFDGVFTIPDLNGIQGLAVSTRRGAQNRSTTAASRRGLNPAGLPAARNIRLFETKPQTLTTSQLYFGNEPHNAPPVSASQSFYCQVPGKVTYSVTGAAFKLVKVQTTEWIDTPSGGTEKQVEYGSSGFNGNPGMQYTVYVEFNPGASTGIQQGNLTISEPSRTIKVPLMGESFSKDLLVTFDKAHSSVNPVRPGDTVKGTVVIDVQQNAPTQLFLKHLSPTGLSLKPVAPFLVKPGKNNIPIEFSVAPTLSEMPQAILPIGVYDASNGKLLASRLLKVAVERQWAEWNYTQKSGNQTIWGKYQLANTGDFIWTIEAHNSSWVYPDRIFHAVALRGQGPQGVSPGIHFQRNLPGRTDRYFLIITGNVTLSNWESARRSPLTLHLSRWDLNPWFSNEIDLIDGVLDCTGVYQMGGPGMISAATYGQNEWLKSVKYAQGKVLSAKAWFE